jgi:hypothetical protein
LLACALCLAAAAPAHAAFAPDLTIGVEPATAGASPSLTAAIDAPLAGGPIERFTLELPPGFTATGAPGASSCRLGELRAQACPADTAVGGFVGRAGPAGFAGVIHKTGPISFGLFLSLLGGSVGQVVEGTVVPRPDGSIELRFPDMPAVSITSLVLNLQGGPRSFVRVPAECGSYMIDGKFTSRAGELAIDRTTLPVTGCAGLAAVTVADVRMSRRAFRAPRTRRGRLRTIIAWHASRAVDHTNVRIERRRHGRWRVARVLVAAGRAGENTIRWDGRVKGRALRAGRYGVRVHPAGSAPAKLLRFRVRR